MQRNRGFCAAAAVLRGRCHTNAQGPRGSSTGALPPVTAIANILPAERCEAARRSYPVTFLTLSSGTRSMSRCLGSMPTLTGRASTTSSISCVPPVSLCLSR